MWKARRGGNISTSFFTTIEQCHIAQQDLHQQNCFSIKEFETNFHNFRLGIPANCLILVQRWRKMMTGPVKMKTYADAKVRAKKSTINIGDTVLAWQKKYNKLSTRFDPLLFRVVRTNGTMITARRSGKYISRIVSHFKVIDPGFHGE